MNGEDEISISTDIKSDISFMNRQKELRNLYRDFRSALDTIHSMNVSIDEEINEEEQEEEEIIIENEVPNDIDLILEEINLLETEISEILQLLSKPKLLKNSRVKSVNKQLNYVQQIISKLKKRSLIVKENS